MKEQVKHLFDVEESNSVTNLLDVLQLNLASNSRTYSKVGGRTVSVRQVFDAFANRQKNIINADRVENGGTKVTQYDAIRMMSVRAFKPSRRDIYLVGDRLCNVLGIEGRPTDDEIGASIDILAKDWSEDPRNKFVDWAEINPENILDELEETETAKA